MVVEPLSRQDPRQVGTYVLLGRLGAGAMGRVYLGRSLAGRLVAVKTIRSDLADDHDFRARFAHEVAAARRVSGIFTASVVAADAHADVPWLATAYVPAPSLERLVRLCGPLPVPAVRWLAAGCAEALESIHSVGLVHRDLKPANVLVSLDGPRVIDFGVARAAERMTLTATRQAVGTPAYMAPEQARDTREAVMASDIFSLGSTLLFAATGHSPYPGRSMSEILVRLATEPPDLSGLPEGLTDLVGWCLERDPDLRPTAGWLLTHMARHSAEEERTFSAASLPPRAVGLIERYRQAAHAPFEDPGDVKPLDEDEVTYVPPGSRSEPDEPSGAGGTPSGPTDATARRDGDDDRASLPAPRRVAGPVQLVVYALSVVLALVLGGTVVGLVLSSQRAAPYEWSGPPQGPPPGDPPAPHGATESSRGKPRLLVNQPMGDGWTVFVVHGRGWPPGGRVSIHLDGGKASPIMPVVDRQGTFNYAVNQQREFFPGRLPPGRHEVTVRASGGGPDARAAFSVSTQ
ncbi:protein kinase domain-containing protein [Sphaerisporangium rubeum]|uniref:Serine/threonine protein kinase n=1 Tax=Sphaerisporangium rubeum TaxID=321317 RepID=A0A7X0M9H6_9ACTN|nr:serine/threonine protein kinase [Sphaerisporangium rubeum]